MPLLLFTGSRGQFLISLSISCSDHQTGITTPITSDTTSPQIGEVLSSKSRPESSNIISTDFLEILVQRDNQTEKTSCDGGCGGGFMTNTYREAGGFQEESTCIRGVSCPVIRGKKWLNRGVLLVVEWSKRLLHS